MDSPAPLPSSILAKKIDPDRAIRVQRAADYPKQVWYLLASFIVFLSICHVISLLFNRARRIQGRNGERGRISLRRVPLAFVNVFRVMAFRWTIPIGNYYTLNVAEIFLTAAYIAIIFTWSLINSTSTIGLKFDPKYYANRAGHIAALQTNLLVALAMKNNILSFLTGISFDKLNYLHRVVARTSCILVWLHAGGRFQLGLSGETDLENPWMRSGVMAAVALTLVTLFALRPIRDASYEFFKIFHFATAVIFILGAYFHSSELGPWGPYIWPAILLWALDVFLRFVRVVLSNVNNTTSIEVLSPHFLRLSVDKPRFFHWRAGQSVYLTLPGISFWQAHPFTIAYEDESKLVFFVRVRKGFSKRLLMNAEQGKMRVWMDGPYSSPPLIRGCDSVVFVAGGSGVAFTLPLFLEALEKSRSSGAPYPRIVFVWAVRDQTHASWIYKPLLKALKDLPNDLQIKIEIYVTDTAGAHEEAGREWDDDSVPPSRDESEEKAGGSANSKDALDPFPFGDVLTIKKGGRPDLDKILSGEVGKMGGGTISVNVCGTVALANAVRGSLRSPRFGDIVRGGPSILLHVEAFGTV
ncbi:ferric reductase NAD binding domain-containing protein [Mucidula mucida]|nr:ferric reductase NAD binding domain-containing protein [Mucidula mucida]